MRHRGRLIFITAAVTVLLVAAELLGINAVLQASRESSQQFGRQLAENYRLQNMAVLARYHTILETGARNVERMREKASPLEQIQAWIEEYNRDILNGLEVGGYTGVYAVLDGQAVSSSRWEMPDDYDPTQREWYQQSVALDGEIYYSDRYQDLLTGEDVVTLAMSLGGGDVMAVDINVREVEQEINTQPMAQGNLHVTFDREGNPICHKCWDISHSPHDAAYFQTLYQQVQAHGVGESFQYKDQLGFQQIVYSTTNKAGWLSVSSVSSGGLSHSNRLLITGISVAAVAYFLSLGIILLREYRTSRRASRNAAVMAALGNTYYAIYLIDTDSWECTFIKPSPDVCQAMEGERSYDRLLVVLSGLMEGEAAGQFSKDFSMEHIRQLLDQKVGSYGGDFQRRFPDGRLEWVNIQLLTTGKELESSQVIFAFQNITQQKQRELEEIRLLEHSLLAAQAGSEAKSSFLSNMSHDMRTPLNAIIGFSQLAQAHAEDPERVRETMEKIRFSSRHLLQLIDDILDMAKIEQGRLDFREEPFDLVELCAQTAEIFQEQAGQQKKRLTYTCTARPCMLEGDPVRVSQVLNNLLSNAVKFTRPGGEIGLELRQLPAGSGEFNSYQIVVRDTGIGMSQEFLKKIYLPFEREERFHAGRVSGTGLGMPIVKSIIQTMNGTIDVDSQVGRGTVFTITLPLRRCQENTAEQDTAPKDAQVSLEGSHILLAEDNELNMEIARELLAMHGAQVVEAYDGRQAVERFAQSPPGYFMAVLMDMQMPVMDGCQAARAIRSMEREDAKTVPIIAVTANAFADDVSKVLEAGMDCHIPKPIDVQRIREAVGAVLASRQK